MRTPSLLASWFFALALAHTLAPAAIAEPFTYQGRLESNGVPANGLYTIRLEVHSQPEDGQELAGVSFFSVPVVDGLFTVTANFPDGIFNEQPRFLEISVAQPPLRLIPLEPRQPIAAAPRADSVRGINVSSTGNAAIGGQPALDARLTVHGTLSITSGGIRFPDGSVMTSAPAAPPAPPSIIYAPGDAPRVQLGDEPVTLAEPFETGVELVTFFVTQPNGDLTIRTSPGVPVIKPIVLRRPLTGDPSWRNWYRDYIQNPIASLRRPFTVVGGSDDRVQLIVPDTFPFDYRVVADAQGVTEFLTITPVIVSTYAPFSTGLPIEATFTRRSDLKVFIAGAPTPRFDVVEISRGTGTNDVQGATVIFRTLTRANASTQILRSAFGGNSDRYSWLANRTRLSIALEIVPDYSVSATNSAFPYRYRLVPLPDGNIIEEWWIATDGEP